MNLFKRKKVSNQERGINLTLEQLKQSTDVRFEEIYNYLDKIAKNMLDEGGAIVGNLNVTGDITQNGQKIGSIIDSLTSTSTTDALSANQGRVLNENKVDTTTVYTGDLNDITRTGFFYCSHTCLNRPVNTNGYLFTQHYPPTPNYAYQRYIVHTTGTTYERVKNGGVWGEWVPTCLNYNDASLKIDTSKFIYITPEHASVSNYPGYSYTYYYKIGTKVHLHIGVKIDTTEWITMFTLPEGFRPASLVSAQGVGSSPQNITGIQIDTAGRVQTSTTSGYCCLDIEYDAGF